jgi:hypothetical protein
VSHDDFLLQNLYADVRALGYEEVQACFQVESIIDVRLIEVFKKYIHKFERWTLTDMLIRCLGHKEYKEAAPYCIEMYRKEQGTPLDKSGGLKYSWGLTICNIGN